MNKENLENEQKEILNRYRNLLRSCADKTNKDDKKLIRKAFNLAVDAHKEARRKSGEPYIYHPIAVAHITAKEIGLGATSIVCALLHDVVEDTDYEIEDIERIFGKKISRIIEGLTKISEVFDQDISLQAENFRKMLLTLSDDVRVILIKLADRLHNMRTLESMPDQKKKKISSETLYLYAPLAHRLGLYPIKTELEDLSLKHTQNDEYRDISNKLNNTKEERKKYIRKFIRPIRRVLKEKELSFKIIGRPKSIYSIRKKMKKQNIDFDHVFDKFAIRIILDTPTEREKSDCWRVYSFVTDFYKPNPDRLRDWISTPKSNGYESLHTTVMGPDGKWVEVQIRSLRMDDIAEKGYAAHWKYKNENSKRSSLDTWINKIRELIDNSETNAIEFIDEFKLNLFSSEIFIFTPNGDLKILPKKSTALDFAFEIHSDVGAHCLGAKVNGKLVPLSHSLSSGDQVEIITSDKQKPKKDWLRFVVTARAKAKIKSSLKEEKKEIAKIGKEIASRKLRHLKTKLDKKTETELIKFFNKNTSLDIYYNFGTGSITNMQIKDFVKAKNSGWYEIIKRKIYKGKQSIYPTQKSNKIIVFSQDEEILPYKLANCCNPIPGDNIFGFTTVEKGINIHKNDCPNSIQLRSNYSYRIIEAKWIDKENIDFIAILNIKGIDRLGLINSVTKIISTQMNVNMRAINIDSNDGVFEGEITLFVHNVSVLNSLIEKLKSVDGVTKIKRIYNKDKNY
tara:strand:- start:8711 stop:10921 length:2211 start_codon:yes stop_codon:yes gene_type:complete